MAWGRFLKSERGAGSIEYAGVLTLIAGVFVAVTLLGLDGRISETVRMAVCQITGGHCSEAHPDGPERCLVSKSTTSANANVLIAVVQIDKDSILIRENYSDGSSKFTIVDGTKAAGELFAGEKAKIGKFGLNANASVEAGVALNGGKVFEFSNQEDANKFQDAVQAAGGFDGILRDLASYNDKIPIIGIDNPLGGIDDAVLDLVGVDDNKDLPTPTETYVEGKAFIDGKAGIGGGAGIIDGELKGLIEGAGVVKVTSSGANKGDVEFTVELKGDVNGNLTAATLGAGAQGKAGVTATISLDAQNGYKPDKLTLKANGSIAGGLDLNGKLEGDELKDITSALKEASFSSNALTGKGIEVSAELDLKDPDNLAATLGVLTGAGDPTAVAGLVDRIDKDGTLGVDTFDLDSSETEGEIKVGVGIGGGAGGKSSEEDETNHTAYERPPGGTFGPKVCKGPPA
jgi:Flp pilus assembly pilin Flp